MLLGNGPCCSISSAIQMATRSWKPAYECAHRLKFVFAGLFRTQKAHSPLRVLKDSPMSATIAGPQILTFAANMTLWSGDD